MMDVNADTMWAFYIVSMNVVNHMSWLNKILYHCPQYDHAH